MSGHGPENTPLTADAAWALLQTLKTEGYIADPRLCLTGPAGWRAPHGLTNTARDLMALHLPLIPPVGHAVWVLGQLGQSLDGRIATETGHSHYVTGEVNRTHVHRLRALCDAVVVGAGTAAADDPRLTVRLCPGGNPVRVILDPRGNLPPDLQVFQDRQAPTLRLCERDAVPRPTAAEVIAFAPADGGLTPESVLAALRARGLKRILIEGGGITVSRFLAAGLLDRLHLAVAPLLIGSGRPGVSLRRIASLNDAYRPQVRRFDMAPDTLFDCIF